MCFEKITQKEVQEVEDKLNNRPRKRFGFQSPNQVYLQKLTTQEKVAFITGIRRRETKNQPNLSGKRKTKKDKRTRSARKTKARKARKTYCS